MRTKLLEVTLETRRERRAANAHGEWSSWRQSASGRPSSRAANHGEKRREDGGGDPGEGEGLKVQIYCLFTR